MWHLFCFECITSIWIKIDEEKCTGSDESVGEEEFTRGKQNMGDEELILVEKYAGVEKLTGDKKNYYYCFPIHSSNLTFSNLMD